MDGHDPAGKRALLDAFASALRGEAPTIPPDVPPHLQQTEWRFVCLCGCTWHHTADAVVLDGKVSPPRESCIACREWVTGRQLTGTWQSRASENPQK